MDSSTSSPTILSDNKSKQSAACQGVGALGALLLLEPRLDSI